MRATASFHIVITDINQHIRNFLQRELEREGYTVHSIKTARMVCEHISGGAEVDLVILDPAIFPSFTSPFVEEIISRNSALQIIVHTYADSVGDITASDRIHLVEKGGQSIRPLKSVIRDCFEQFRGNRSS